MSCATKSPRTGAAFNVWHPDLVTLHVWAWYPNPNGVFSGMNPLMHLSTRVTAMLCTLVVWLDRAGAL